VSWAALMIATGLQMEKMKQRQTRSYGDSWYGTCSLSLEFFDDLPMLISDLVHVSL
jgi:hypothetical protein